jgi:hypothetical protein
VARDNPPATRSRLQVFGEQFVLERRIRQGGEKV